MTIRFLKPWNGYQPDAVVSGLTNEAALIAGGLASDDLDGGNDGRIYEAKFATDASGNVSLVGPNNRNIRAIYDPSTPVLLIGGDHPYQQWWGSNGADGMAAWYNANGITPYLAINTTPGGGTTPGGTDQMSWDQLRTLIEAGRIECIGHGHRHYQDNTGPTSGFTVTYTGAAATATFQVTGGNAVGVTAGGVADFSFSLSSASYDTLAELKAAIDAVSGWSATLASELTGSEKSGNCLTGVARNAKSTSVDWPVAGGLTVSYVGTTYDNVGLQIDSTYLYVYGDGRRVGTIALSGNLSTIATSLATVSGVTAALAGQSSSPNYVQGTEIGTSLNKWQGMLWLSATPVALEAGLSSGYLKHRNNLVNKTTAAANGVVLRDFAQSGAQHYEQGAASSIWRIQRGNSVDGNYWFPACLANDFIPHVSLRASEFNTAGKLTAILDALADSRGHLCSLLMHKVLPDGATGYSLPTSDYAYYDQTETAWEAMLSHAKPLIESGAIAHLKYSEFALNTPKPPANWLFNPKFKNSGEPLLVTSAYVMPGWSLNMASGFSAASVSDGEISLTVSSSSTMIALYQVCNLPSGTWEFTADVELEGYTSGNGIGLVIGRYKSRNMPEIPAGNTTISEVTAQGNARVRAVFEVPANAMELGRIKSVAGPFNLSTNTNIWLYINGQTAIDNINCAAGAANSAAVTAKEAAAAINAAIVTAGWPPEYHTAAKAVGSQVVITCPYITPTHTSYVEIRAAGSNSATAVLFGSALNHYGKSRTSSGDWRSGSWLVGFTAAMNVGATARIKNPMLRRAVSAVR